jgi:hypothetical protein
MDGDEEQPPPAAWAEPDECSRRGMTCLLGCVGAAIVSLSMYLLEPFHHLGFLLMLLGIFFVGLCVASLLERFMDDPPLGNPQARRMSMVDGLLSI